MRRLEAAKVCHRCQFSSCAYNPQTAACKIYKLHWYSISQRVLLGTEEGRTQAKFAITMETASLVAVLTLAHLTGTVAVLENSFQQSSSWGLYLGLGPGLQVLFQQEFDSLHKCDFILHSALGEVTCKSFLLCGSQPRYYEKWRKSPASR